jgi:hypothetical protein
MTTYLEKLKTHAPHLKYLEFSHFTTGLQGFYQKYANIENWFPKNIELSPLSN